ncbi:hypothetical protein [Nitrospirillum viridazoti]|uniref:hypothetical protein n=1 Tax=Nitrospirillum viridazoti TaxID=3144925 RepID=UPI0011AD98EE|nr:hypothetical protein [Nitrospirillum amazonense]TWB29395.1 hypothetical protein FBZ91_12663 [Nitrospirillum amazonense]
MTADTLDGRARLSIELALTAGSPDPRQDAAARALGMSGAEIDAARQGWSFDVRTSLALGLALAAEDLRQDRRARALKAGIPEAACREIEALARQADTGGGPRHV